jgi:ammonium transporter, Amt family
MNSPNQSRVDFGGLSNGILAGLVAITANNHTVEAWAALVIGSLGGLFYSLACKVLEKLEIDDPLEVTQIHMVNGIWGTIATAFFKKQDGIFYGG